MVQVKSATWCFTLNNPTAEDTALLEALPTTYLVYGREKAPTTGTPHLQGYLRFASKRVMPKIKAHWTKAKGTDKQNFDYCTKEDSAYFEKGEMAQQGRRTDLVELYEDIKSGTRNKRSLIESHTNAMAKFPRFAQTVLNLYRPKPPCPDILLRPWQQDLIEVIKLPVHDRHIHWIWSEHGDTGKSTFATYIEAVFDNVQVMLPTKQENLAYLLDEDTRVLILDCPRCNEFLPYSFMEQVKNRRVQSTKYEPVPKYLTSHLIVFANIPPEEGKLSTDRLVVTQIQ